MNHYSPPRQEDSIMNHLEIEWRHLDKGGTTCDRCAETGNGLKSAVETLAKEFHPGGWRVTLKETLLTENEIPESNSIFLNGIPIEDLLPETHRSENCCVSCGEILGAPTMCRTLVSKGQVFETIPSEPIIEAARRFIQTHKMKE